VYPTPSSFDVGPGTDTYVRPFFGHERTRALAGKERGPGASETGDVHRWRSFPPFLELRRGPDEYQNLLLPFYLYREYPQPLGGVDRDWMLFPLLFGGDDPDEGSYFAFFPFAGNIKGILGQDEIVFYMFPAYWYQRDRKRESLHIVWPFYNEAWGGDWKGWRIWPFYGRYRYFTDEGILRHHRRFVGWPFYIRYDEQQHILPTEILICGPFYGHRLNARVVQKTYLWPFYIYGHDRRYDRTLHGGYLFPYRFTEGQRDFWPLFGEKLTNRGTLIGGLPRRTYREFFLWPIQRYLWGADGFEESMQLWILPVFWHFYYIDRDTLETRKHLKVWPFFSYTRDGGDVALDVISPLWFRREEFERFYSRWFQVFRYRSRAGISGWEALWGAVTRRKEPSRGDDLFSVLGGLLELGERGGASALRIFYIPWRTD